jgi:hypothetical protein
VDPKPELLKALADALNSYDEAVRDLIRDELETTVRPGLEAARDQAAARLADAYAALGQPQQQVAETDEAIAFAERELASHREDLGSSSVSVRANSRPHVTEWEAELSSLRQKKTQQTDALQAFTDEHRAARDALAQAEIALGGYEMNLKVPFIGYGARTDAYRAFRIGSYPAWLTLQANNTDHPEFDAFFGSLDSVAQATGYTTDALSDRLRIKAMEETQANFATKPEPVPSGKDVADSLTVTMENAALGKLARETVSRIDDFRRPAVPRNSAVRDYMRLPGKS